MNSRVFVIFFTVMALILNITADAEGEHTSRSPDYTAPIPYFHDYRTYSLEFSVLESRKIDERYSVAAIRLLVTVRTANNGSGESISPEAEFFAIIIYDTSQKAVHMTLDIFLTASCG